MSPTAEELEVNLRRVLAQRAAEITVQTPAPTVASRRVADTPRGRRFVSRDRAAITAVIAVTVAIAAAAIVLFNHGHTNAAATDRPPRLRTAATTVREFADVLSVLRRPRTAADRDRIAARLSSGLLGLGTPVILATRLAATTSTGSRVFLTPLAPLRHYRLPEGIAPHSAIADHLRREARTPRILFQVGTSETADTIKQIRAGNAILSRGGRPSQIVILVPNGIRTVKLDVPGKSNDSSLVPAVSTVHDNIATFLTSSPILDTDNMTWYGPSGKAVKRIDHSS
jgi:hypothetical protein